MKFIAQNGYAQDVGTQVLTDGKATCTYADLPDAFAAVGSDFEQRGIDPDVCLAFECDNSVLSAVVLLFLLESGFDFLLIPKRAGGGIHAVRIPPFCEYTLATSSGRFTGLDNPDFVNLAPNSAYQGGSRRVAEPQLYVRTSGSTGAPKLAVHSHSGLRQNALNCIERLQAQSTDRVAIPVPLYHMYGLGAAFLPALAVGASIDLQEGANVIGYIAREREFQPTRAFLTPTFCQSLLRGRRSPRAYELTVTAGDRHRGDTFDRYEARYGPIVQLYGSTELGAIAAASPDDAAGARAHAVGKPLPDVEVRCRRTSPAVDGDRGGDTGELGELGEVSCRHPYGFCGYADENGALRDGTARRVDDWFPMHDLGRIGPDGRLQVWGRSDHAVNRSGILVMFADIEAAIMTVPGIEVAVVVASGESDYGSGIAAFCVPDCRRPNGCERHFCGVSRANAPARGPRPDPRGGGGTPPSDG